MSSDVWFSILFSHLKKKSKHWSFELSAFTVMCSETFFFTCGWWCALWAGFNGCLREKSLEKLWSRWSSLFLCYFPYLATERAHFVWGQCEITARSLGTKRLWKQVPPPLFSLLLPYPRKDVQLHCSPYVSNCENSVRLSHRSFLGVRVHATIPSHSAVPFLYIEKKIRMLCSYKVCIEREAFLLARPCCRRVVYSCYLMSFF